MRKLARLAEITGKQMTLQVQSADEQMLRIGFGELDDESQRAGGVTLLDHLLRRRQHDARRMIVSARPGRVSNKAIAWSAWPALACRTPRTSRYNVSLVWAETSERRVPASSHCPADARIDANCSLEACVGSTSQRRRAKRSAQILSRDRCAIWAAYSSSRASVAAAMAAFTSTPSSTRPANFRCGAALMIDDSAPGSRADAVMR